MRLHDEVDRDARRLALKHADRIQCARGCSGCCLDDLTVFEVEAAVIRDRHAELLADGNPHPKGACAFLDAEGACRIYEERPYVCRTQGLPLRWIDEDATEDRVEMRDICELNELPDRPVERLPATECWTLGPFESRLALLQTRGGNPPRRVRLRDLFHRPSDDGASARGG
jgi:Fe-S-cluster containining protein